MNLTFISAGAGSGKTYTLTQTLGRLLRSGATRPSGVIATTFTKKAATELRERVRQSLLESGEFMLANAMEQARIGTVNSVCGNLLARFAFEAGLPTEQQVLEEGQVGVLIREAIGSVMSNDEVTQLSAIAYRLGIENWADELQTLITQCRANDISVNQLPRFAQENAEDLLQYFPPPSSRDLTKELTSLIDQALPALRQAATNSTVKKTKEYLSTLESFNRRLKGGSAAWADWVALGKNTPEKNLLNAVAPIQTLALQVCGHPELHQDIRTYLEKVFVLCGVALEHYGERKLALGVVDFTDQEHLLLKLLDHPHVEAVLRDELDLLLVDEFQDTSPIQLALFLKLSQLAKNTYWVGDLKQAIYGFRGSDTALMQSMLAALPKLGGNKEVLGSSWRSRPSLVNLVNKVFVDAFAETLPPEEVRLNPKREETPSLSALEIWKLEGVNVREIATSLGHGVKQLLESGKMIPDAKTGQLRPLCPKDIAILCRTNDGIAQVAASLRGQGVPVATTRPGLLSTPEVTLALACLRRLNDTSDTVATAEIISLAESAEPEIWLADRLAHLAGQGSKTLWREEGENPHPLLQALARLRVELPVMAPREALRRVLVAAHIEQIVLTWRQDVSIARLRLANLESLLSLASNYEDNCRSSRQAATISGLLIWLKEQAAEGLDAQADPALDAVRVITHHAAKGLEWPVVILFDLEKEVHSCLWGISARSQGEIDAMNPLGNRFIRYWPWPFGKQSAGIETLEIINKTEIAARFQAEAVAEARRLLYVSMTRPREVLILALKKKAKTTPWLDTLGASWIQSVLPETTVLKLDDEHDVRVSVSEVGLPSDVSSAAKTHEVVHWFPEKTQGTYIPRDCNPSAIGCSSSRILNQQKVGERLSVQNGVDWGLLGSAIHACIAFHLTQPSGMTEADINKILCNFGVSPYISSAGLLKQLLALQKWINKKWSGCKLLTEVPVKAILENGQHLQGRIDLLLETENGYILIDHKSSPLAEAEWQKLANDYAGQLAAYTQAVNQCGEKKVVEQWLFLPVAGGAVSLSATA